MYKNTRKYFRRTSFGIGLLLFFWFGLFCAAVFALVLLYPGAWRSAYVRNFYKASSRLCASMFGKSGRMMLSTEVVFDERLKLMRTCLDEIEDNHCIKSVWAESPYSRLSDKQIRAK